MSTAEIVLYLFGGYFALGIPIGLVFIAFFVSRVDHAAKGSSIGFRLLILPGAIALWPLILRHIARRRRAGDTP